MKQVSHLSHLENLINHYLIDNKGENKITL